MSRPATSSSQESASQALKEAGFIRDPDLDIDNVTMSVPISATPWRSTRTSAANRALIDIYRVMRPGEPPTIEAAQAMFHSLFFDPSAMTCRRSAG